MSFSCYEYLFKNGKGKKKKGNKGGKAREKRWETKNLSNYFLRISSNFHTFPQISTNLFINMRFFK